MLYDLHSAMLHYGNCTSRIYFCMSSFFLESFRGPFRYGNFVIMFIPLYLLQRALAASLDLRTFLRLKHTSSDVIVVSLPDIDFSKCWKISTIQESLKLPLCKPVLTKKNQYYRKTSLYGLWPTRKKRPFPNNMNNTYGTKTEILM